MLTDSDVSRLCRLRNPAWIGNLEQIDSQLLIDTLAVPLELDLENCFERGSGPQA
jgi:hypothetical protein